MHGALFDASPVRAHRVFASASPDESRHGLAAELVEHRLAWGPGTVDTRFSRVRLERVSMAVLRYGAEVEVRPQPLRDFVLVQMPLQGRAEIDTGNGTVAVSPQVAAVVSPNHPVRLRWQAGCEQLLIKVPLSALRAVAASALQRPEPALPAACFEFAPQLDLHGDTGRAWCGLVTSLLHSVPAPGAPAFDARWRQRLEDSALLFLLVQQPNALSAALASGAGTAPRGGDPLDRLQRYIADRLCAPVSLLDLSRAAGVGVRRLHTLCRERLQAPPMTVLRQARLDAVRQRLLQGGASVGEIALAHGFEHLGRFSAYYRQRFGELPSQTALAVQPARQSATVPTVAINRMLASDAACTAGSAAAQASSATQTS